METKLVKKILAEMDQNNERAKSILAQFYPDGEQAEIVPAADQTVFSELLEKAKQVAAQPNLTQEELEEKCFEIKASVKEGRGENVEIRLDQMQELFERMKYPLGKVIIKVWLWGEDESPRYLFIKEDCPINVRIYIGGENHIGIIAIKDEEGDVSYVRLAEFHMLSIRENPDPSKEVGLMASYNWLTARIFSSIILALNLDPIRNLILSDYLESEWKQAQENSGQASDKEIGGEGDE